MCQEIQQKFYENLGNREYDCFQSSEEKYLKLKIGFTLFGAPQNDEHFNNLDGDYTVVQLYDKNQNEAIDNVYSVIKSRSVNNEDRDQVIVGFMFNCCEFPQKKRRYTNISNIKQKENVGCYPIFRVKKCTGSTINKNCCAYVDEFGRVYKTWDDYLKNNKIPKAKMFVPKDGKYQGNENGEVQLEEILSPACALKENIIKVADYSSTAASLISGGIAIGAMIPAVTVAPILVSGALLTGAGVGVYSIFRSSLVLHDRKQHSQSISVKNNEARNCYLNMAAGATSVVTTGATKVAMSAWNKGVTIGEGAVTALVSVNALNIAVSGCSVANSVYKLVIDFKNKRNISTFDIMQFSATVLFFGNAVVSYKSAMVIYNEAQATSFADSIRIRSQDLLNRAKNTFFKTDMTSTENNSSMKIVENSGDFCSNAINLAIREKSSAVCRSTLNLLTSLIDTIDLESALRFGFALIENKDNALGLCKVILSRFDYQIQEGLINLTKYLFGDITKECLETINQLFPKKEKIVILLNFVISFLKFKVTEKEIQYFEKKTETVRKLNISEEEYDDNYGGFRSTAERMTYFLKLTVITMMRNNGQPEEIIFREMISFFWGWLSKQTMQYAFRQSQNQIVQPVVERQQVNCSDCGGHFFVN